MTLRRNLAEQLARPHGYAGRLLGSAMDIVNRKPTRLAIDLLAPRAGESVLDAGCGTGAAMAEILGRVPCHLTGIDPSPTMARQASIKLLRERQAGNAVVVDGRIEDMKFADASFDAVLALNVLYFSDGEGRMVARLARSLKPGGRLIAYVTHRETMQHWSFAREGIHRLFDGEALRDLLVAGGFACARIDVQEVAITRSVKGLLARAEL